MSGGYFDYDQYRLDEIATSIRKVILFAKGKYSEETIKEFRKARDLLQKAAIYANRIDWLLSGDDGEDTFHERLQKDLEALERTEAQLETPSLVQTCHICKHFEEGKCKYLQKTFEEGWCSATELQDLQSKCETDAAECWDFEPSEEIEKRYF